MKTWLNQLTEDSFPWGNTQVFFPSHGRRGMDLAARIHSWDISTSQLAATVAKHHLDRAAIKRSRCYKIVWRIPLSCIKHTFTGKNKTKNPNHKKSQTKPQNENPTSPQHDRYLSTSSSSISWEHQQKLIAMKILECLSNTIHFLFKKKKLKFFWYIRLHPDCFGLYDFNGQASTLSNVFFDP